jgi:hypothetical protein
MRRLLGLAVVALVVGETLCGGGVRADDGQPQPMVILSGPEPAVYDPAAGMMPAPASPESHHHRPLRDWLHKLPWHCYADHNTLGCGNLKSECQFLFGSCRSFYGEPCLPPPPKPNGQPGALPAPGRCACP